MQTSLRSLRDAQEAFAGEHGRYSLDIQELEFNAGPHIVVAISSANAVAGWRAIAVHADSDVTCYTGGGKEANSNDRDGVRCDGPNGPVGPHTP
jgi:hypothetical protein